MKAQIPDLWSHRRTPKFIGKAAKLSENIAFSRVESDGDFDALGTEGIVKHRPLREVHPAGYLFKVAISEQQDKSGDIMRFVIHDRVGLASVHQQICRFRNTAFTAVNLPS